MAKINITNNFNELKKSADNLHSTVKKLNKETDKLNEVKSNDNIFANAYKGLDKADKSLRQIRESMKGLNKDSQTYQNLQKQENQFLYQKKKVLEDIKNISSMMIASQNEEIQLEGKKVQTQINGYKQQQKINNGIQQSIRYHAKINELEQQKIKNIDEQNRKIQQQQREIERLEQKAKEAGSLTKSMLQNEGLNTKGSKNTQAQYEYQIERLKETLSLIRETEGASEKYSHALKSMTYEVKHVTGKELYQDALKSIQELTRLENKRFEAQKSGKVIMEDYYNTEIQKQKEVLNGILQTANDPKQLKDKLQQNYKMIYDSLADMPDIQKDFAEQFKQTGNLTQAWSNGMKNFVAEAKNGIEAQEQLNQKLLEQYNLEQKEKEYLSLLQQKFQLENKLTDLTKDKKSTRQNQNQIQEYQKQIQLINEKLQKIEQEAQFTNKTKKAVDELTQSHNNERNAIIAKNKDIEETNGLLSGTLGNFMKFTAYYATLNALKQGINEALESMKELDKAFTDIQMVTNGTDEETAQLAQEYNSLAKELGSTTIEVAEGAGEWLRQGKTATETTDLLRASMTLSKVGAIESSQATQLLTSSLNGYKMEAKDAMSVVDKISAIDLAAATSSEELATALARTANIANDSRVSFDKLLAMIGTVSSVTRRSAETIRRIIQNNILSYEQCCSWKRHR